MNRERKYDFGNRSHSLDVPSRCQDERDLKCSLLLLYVPVTQAASERNAATSQKYFYNFDLANIFSILICIMETVAFEYI